jgi:hypothetical protein
MTSDSPAPAPDAAPAGFPSADLWPMLRALDDPENVEYPAGFDNRSARLRFDALADRLDTAFGCRCPADRDHQDATLYGRVIVPAPATATGVRLVVSVSNFGPLAVLSLENPDVYTDAEAAELLDAEDHLRVRESLAASGHVLIPEEPLMRRYDGAWPPGAKAENFTWWTRFFGYL